MDVTLKLPAPVPLLAHQGQAYRYLAGRKADGLGGALYMEMRLGKTTSLIRFLKEQFPGGTHLVIAPKSVMKTWANELRLNNAIRSYTLLVGTKQDRIELLGKNSRWFIVNFEMVESLDILSYYFDTCTVDESIRISNPKAKAVKYLLSTIERIKFRYILCGNPAPESTMQYITQFLFMQGSFLGKKTYWAVRAEYYDNSGYNWWPKPGVKEMIYAYVHANAFVLTRKDVGVGSLKKYTTRYVEMTNAQRKCYDSMFNNFEWNNLSTNYHISQTIYLAKIAGGIDPSSPENAPVWLSTAKIEEIIYLLHSELKGMSVLIWCRFKHEANKIYEDLREAGFVTDLVTGDVSTEHRELIRSEFQKGTIQVVVFTIKAGKVGNNWSRADYEMYYSNEYSNDDRSQSEDRVVGTLDRDTKFVVDLCTSDTIDEDIVELLRDKRVDSDMLMSQLWGRIIQRRSISNV